MSIAIDVAGILKEELQKHPGQKLESVMLTIGELSGIEVESLQFSLEAVFAEENWPDVSINIKKAPLMAVCNDCGNEFEPEAADFRCSACSSGNIQITSGQSLTINSIILQ